ncbi:MAG: hemolysin-type calcium-binding protein [Rhodobacterales bacterium RIFCSPHIGHO2_02_FULL_62_130]|nr:MAG: hemolysin-type calcium-binding protein [Rhodobacterales bacterium RIFCSPHIGHO2_02_FULL_62_130]OHC59881.1 MAG: hemolysin-type calcium-binding protein [Rhodobacterales bacterium RIFCSPHIGHO2_12_FULL_62_75]HCZ00263.1 hemolysin-type calcium-binding protein [Rhodobacter sp.]
MKTGSMGTFVISWSQTEVDGLKAASLDLLSVGATWRWTGAAVRVDGPQGVLLLEGAEGATDIRKRAARMVRRLVGVAVAGNAAPPSAEEPAEDLAEQGFIVTDGHQSFTVTIIPVPDTGARLLMVVGDLPPVDQDLWVVRAAIDRTHSGAGARTAGGVICFTPDTRLMTPDGARAIQSLRPGDLILTRDNGPQPVLWSGHRRMSGARLYAMPHLRPIRFRAGALGTDRPDADLLVSPQHRMLVKGASALALFNTPEVLVAAEDLVNDGSIMVDQAMCEVTYVHILLEQHNIVWANGLETESFHPSNTALDTIDPVQREGLLAILPGVAQNPHGYGDYARRNLSGSEAAILRHDMAA